MKNINEISYTLSKQVPAMLRGFAIQTNYGDLWIDAKDAAPFAELANKLLEKQYLAARPKGGQA